MSPDWLRKWRKFRRDRLAWGSLWLLLALALLTLPAELLCNDRPLAVRWGGRWFFPVLVRHAWQDFGLPGTNEPDWKGLERRLRAGGGGGADSAMAAAGDAACLARFDPEPGDVPLLPGLAAADSAILGRFDPEPGDVAVTAAPPGTGRGMASGKDRPAWFLWPPVRYGYATIARGSAAGRDSLLSPRQGWADGHWLGTDDRGRDVLARLAYGFRVCLWFGLALAAVSVVAGTILGGIQGFAGGWLDLAGQRLMEIWGAVPKLYLLMILTSLLARRSVGLLLFILALTSWMGLAAYTRAEFLRGRNLEYVRAARALGVGAFAIMGRHLLPNSLTPVITFFPFMISGGMLALTSLDFLDLGVEAPYPSLGELLAQGQGNLHATWIILPAVLLLTATITLLTFIGTGVRTAFDPRQG